MRSGRIVWLRVLGALAVALSLGLTVACASRRSGARRGRAIGAGLTYCSGFSLDVGGTTAGTFTVRVTASMRGGQTIAPPAPLLEQALAIEDGTRTPRELRVRTKVPGDKAVGHLCMERFTVHLDDAAGRELLELELFENQSRAEARVVRGSGFTTASDGGVSADGPVTIRYEPWHGFID
jgi:hypothetical protein